MPFIKGLALCEGFFFDAVKPILDAHFVGMPYTAGLLGYGSDVLGYDDEVSTDHLWGPRLYLFLREKDVGKKQDIMDVLMDHLPFAYKGYSVNFSAPIESGGGVRVPESITQGRVSPLLFIHTVDEYLQAYLGTSDLDHITAQDWLAFSEHRLLALTSGALFLDGLGVRDTLFRLRAYPEDVVRYLVASNWSLIAEEQAFVRRCFDVGDAIGSALVCARIADRLMRLCFLYCGRYAPYSKWFGTAFARLPVADEIKRAIAGAIEATGIDAREEGIVRAQKLVADLHNLSGITEPVDVRIESYFERRIKVIFADKIARAVMDTLAGTPFEHFPLIGTLSGVANFTNLFDNPTRRESVKELYR